jgi:uncharacterized membrane protein YtjA (UPF0391 family)
LGADRAYGVPDNVRNAVTFVAAQTRKTTGESIAASQPPPPNPNLFKEFAVLHYAIVFLVVALFAALLGFGGLASGAAGIAKLLFAVFVLLAVVSAVIGLMRRG